MRLAVCQAFLSAFAVHCTGAMLPGVAVDGVIGGLLVVYGVQTSGVYEQIRYHRCRCRLLCIPSGLCQR
jgi:hypothetical protein